MYGEFLGFSSLPPQYQLYPRKMATNKIITHGATWD